MSGNVAEFVPIVRRDWLPKKGYLDKLHCVPLAIQILTRTWVTNTTVSR